MHFPLRNDNGLQRTNAAHASRFREINAPLNMRFTCLHISRSHFRTTPTVHSQSDDDVAEALVAAAASVWVKPTTSIYVAPPPPPPKPFGKDDSGKGGGKDEKGKFSKDEDGGKDKGKDKKDGKDGKDKKGELPIDPKTGLVVLPPASKMHPAFPPSRPGEKLPCLFSCHHSLSVDNAFLS